MMYFVTEHKRLTSMKTISVEDVQKVFQNYSSGQIKKPKIGKLSIVNSFISDFRGTELLKIERKYVFYAVEKFSVGLFSKSMYRMFIWHPVSEHVFAVPVESVSFEAPKRDENGCYPLEMCLVLNQTKGVAIATKTDGNTKHQLFLESQELYRTFGVTSNRIDALKDVQAFNLRWSDSKEHFLFKIDCDAMYHLRYGFKDVSDYIFYPKATGLHSLN